MFIDKSIENYLEILSSDAPTPGGGSALAVVCSVAIGLVEMACNVTITKYAKNGLSTPELQSVLPQLQDLRKIANKLVDDDSKVFNQILEAMRLPKTNEEEIEARKQALQQSYKMGATVPLELMKTAYLALPLADVSIEHSDQFVVSDAHIGKSLLLSVIKNATHNVDVNTCCIKDQSFVQQCEQQKQLYLSAK